MLKERDHLENLVVNLRIVLKWKLIGKRGRGVNWIHMAQDSDQFCAFAYVVINFPGTQRWESLD